MLQHREVVMRAEAFRPAARQVVQSFRRRASSKSSIFDSSLPSRNSRIRGGKFQTTKKFRWVGPALGKAVSPSFVFRRKQQQALRQPELLTMSALVLEEVETLSTNQNDTDGALSPSSSSFTDHNNFPSRTNGTQGLPYFANQTVQVVAAQPYSSIVAAAPINGTPLNGETTTPLLAPAPEEEAASEDSLLQNNNRRWWQRGPLKLVFRDSASRRSNINSKKETATPTTRSIWRHRHARSAEEGIRRETTTTTTAQPPPSISSARQLSSVLAKKANGSIERTSRHYAARTITGLINALAEEVDDLDVEVESRRDTPLKNKHVDAVRIKFSRLGFKPLRMGGHDSPEVRQEAANQLHDNFFYRNWQDLKNRKNAQRRGEEVTLTADEAFDRIDVDQSGFLDRDELVQALSLVARTSANSTQLYEDIDNESNLPILEDLASDLFALYDINGDGVVDRKEYKNMVEDMAALQRAEALGEQRAAQEQELDPETTPLGEGWVEKASNFLQNRTWWWSSSSDEEKHESLSAAATAKNDSSDGPLAFFDKWKRANVDDTASDDAGDPENEDEAVDVSSEVVGVTKTFGSITFSDLKMDVRQLLFGALPLVKHVTPGGPLILEPFRTTMTGSFNREDILNSVLLDMGLRRLVMRVVRKRVGSLRDVLEGAVFRGRSWKTYGGEGGPKVEITELTNVEFDKNDKLIITGRARVRTRPGAAVIEQAFKVRTSIGTRKGGRYIRLEEPELALVIECPKDWETT